MPEYMPHSGELIRGARGIHGRLAYATAYLISLYALDVLVPIIDIFGVPLPRYVASMSLSGGFILGAFSILIPMDRAHRITLIGVPDFALFGMLVFWAGLEIIGMAGFGHPRFDLIMEFVPLLLVLAASRIHLQLFDDARFLMSAMVLTGSSMVLTHTILLIASILQIPLPFINMSELYGRNGMALVAPVCIWLLAFFPLKGWPVFGHRYNFLLLLALVNILLNSARTASLILVWCVLAGAVLQLPKLRRWVELFLLPAGLIVIVMVMFACPILLELSEQGFIFWGSGDDAVSVLSRAKTNALLLDKLAQDVLLGIGWGEVAATKALGYMGHTLYVNALAAYGVIGALAAICVLVLGLATAPMGNRETATHLLFLAILIASFSNNVFAYFGVMIPLAGAVKMPRIFCGTVENDFENSSPAC